MARESGRITESRAWLSRAWRLAPDNPTVGLLHAAALLEHDRAGCDAVLRRLLRRYPEFREALVLHIVCAVRQRDPATARDRLAALLRVQAPPRDARFRQLANAVAAAARAPGWVCVRGDGTVILSRPGTRPGTRPGARQGGGKNITLTLDDAPLEFFSRRAEKIFTRGGGGEQKIPAAAWRHARLLRASVGGVDLLGSPVDLASIRRIEGVVDGVPGGGLTGWARQPADPDQPVSLDVLISAAGSAELLPTRIVADGPSAAMPDDASMQQRGFKIAAADLPARGTVRIVGPDGRDLAGSPVALGREAAANHAAAARLGRLFALPGTVFPGGAADPDPPDVWRPMLAPPDADAPNAGIPHPEIRGTPPARKKIARRPVDIVIPVFRGAADFCACLATLRGQLSAAGGRIIVVDDASPDAALCRAVDAAAARGDIVVLRHPETRGFPAAANTGLRHALAGAKAPRDVLLLNPDTLLPAGAVERLARAAYAAVDIGTVTPLTNDGTIVSYPRPGSAAAMPDAAALRRLDDACQAANAGRLVDLPTGIGFCLYLRHDCLAATGAFREDVFAQGYGEENDFCLRASHLGWRHVAACAVFVAHAGGKSFGAVKSHLIARNTRLLNRLHPGYDALVAAFARRDPLAPPRQAVDLQLWRQQRVHAGAVVLISHAGGGGVARHVEGRAAAVRAAGLRPIVLEPAAAADDSDGPAGACRLADPSDPDAASPRFVLPAEFDALVDALRGEDVRWVELHHVLGHAPEIAAVAETLSVPLDVFVHDHAAWCPRVTLVGRSGKYCGEPGDVAECAACVRDLGGRLGEAIGPAELRARSAAWLGAARRVVVSCQDAASRMRRHFPFLAPVVMPWEDEATLLQDISPPALVSRAATSSGSEPGKSGGPKKRIVVAGGIGADKGFDVLLACARDAARRDLALDFVLVGHSSDDARLLETGRVFVTGRFEESEGVALIVEQQADLGFIPSVCPETWCYALSLLWRGGLAAVCFDLGAQAERIRRAGIGAVLPLGLPIARLNDVLLELAAAPRLPPRADP